ncbi:hypothetical protein [Hymenobacter tenuis]
MKSFFLLTLLLAATGLGHSAQAQATTAEVQALTKQLDQLMRNPKKPKQDVHLTLKGCHAEQLIRDRDADVQMSNPVAVSFGSGNSGWAMKMDNGVFEMKMGFEWADVSPLTYQMTTDDQQQKHFQISINRDRKGTHSNFELPLYTTNEATVKDVVRRLEKIRKSCGGK